MKYNNFPPELYLILSVDIINSTAFKNDSKHIEDKIKWMNFFKEFFTDFSGKFIELSNKEITDIEIKVWKTLGDEILYYILLKDIKTIPKILTIFINTIKEYRTVDKNKELPINFKAASWIIGVPVGNLKISSDPNDENKIDFIGPLVDIGFRISKMATKRKFIISADLAQLLIDCKKDNKLKIYYEGGFEFKGVLSGKKYPIFWIDADENSIELLEEKMLNGKEKIPCNIETIEQYLTHFFSSQKVVMKPFIYVNKENIDIDDYNDEYSKIVKEVYKYEIENGEDIEKEGVQPTDIEEIINNIKNEFEN